MKPVEIVLRRRGGGRGRMMNGVNLRYIVNTYVNITTYLPIQLLYANKIKKFKKGKKKNKVLCPALKTQKLFKSKCYGWKMKCPPPHLKGACVAGLGSSRWRY
jgi:hypothetical protein